MNSEQTKKLEALLYRLVEVHKEFENLACDVEEIGNDLEAKWDGKSEKWQDGDKGQEQREVFEKVQEVANDLATIYETADNAWQTLKDALENAD